MAIYSSQYPKTVGPVRSARISDIELLRQYGQGRVRVLRRADARCCPVLAKADRLIDVSDDHGGLGYHRDFSRDRAGQPVRRARRCCSSAPANPAQAVDVGFTFDDAVPAGGTPVTQVTARTRRPRRSSPGTPPPGAGWPSMNGRKADGDRGRPARRDDRDHPVLDVTRSIYHDFLGNYTPLSRSVGTGNALILRNGQAWKRRLVAAPAPHAGTTGPSAARPFPLAAGPDLGPADQQEDPGQARLTRQPRPGLGRARGIWPRRATRRAAGAVR